MMFNISKQTKKEILIGAAAALWLPAAVLFSGRLNHKPAPATSLAAYVDKAPPARPPEPRAPLGICDILCN